MNFATPPSGHPAFRAHSLTGMTPWACSYKDNGRRFAVTLYASSPEQILADHARDFDDLRVDGELLAVVPADDQEAWREIEAWEGAVLPTKITNSALRVEGHELRQQLMTRGTFGTPPADRKRLSVASAPRGERRLNVSRPPMASQIQARPIAPYIGGKRNLSGRITRIIDAHDHRTYAEPFVGMGGVFLRRRSRPRSEFINDAGREVFNLFRIIQEHYVAFLDLLRFQITTQAGFEHLCAVDPETLTDLQRAARFLFLQRTAFGGKVSGRNFGIATDRPARFNITTLEPDIEALHERLSGVTVTCMDFEAFIDRIDRPTALFYLDPPYWGSEGDYGKELFARSDFERLAASLRGLKGNFLLSLNDRPEVRALFCWAELTEAKVTYTIAKGAAKQVGELLISNFDLKEGRDDAP